MPVTEMGFNDIVGREYQAFDLVQGYNRAFLDELNLHSRDGWKPCSSLLLSAGGQFTMLVTKWIQDEQEDVSGFNLARDAVRIARGGDAPVAMQGYA